MDKKVIVGMSGGVDSSVAAALVKQQGYTVTGVTMRIWPREPATGKGRHGCYGPEEEQDIEDAKRIAQKLHVPLHVIDLAEAYRAEVLDYFCSEYLAGRTPNPCVRCNRRIKFGALLDRAASMGLEFDYFATGHYARLEKDEKSGRQLLRRGKDSRKDQSYFLYNLTQGQLSRSLFPLGNYMKAEVKQICREMGLGVEEKQESQNFVCGDYSSLFSKPLEAGPIVDKKSRVLGHHRGIVFYTVGQRHGLRIGSRQPLFVTAIDAEKNAIVAGPKEDLYVMEQKVRDLNWIAVESLKGSREVRARVRSTHQGYKAVISALACGVNVVYSEPQIGAAPGQAIVFYDGDVVLGGGIAC